MMKIDLSEAIADWANPEEWPHEPGYEAFVNLAFSFSRYVLAPRILADTLRRQGDERASPRDFECECPVLAEMNRPYCLFLREYCRFAGSGAATIDEAATMLGHSCSPADTNRFGVSADLERMMLKSVNQNLACDLMFRIGRKFLDAAPDERAAMLSEMEREMDRMNRRETRNLRK